MEKLSKKEENYLPFNPSDLVDSNISQAHINHHKFYELKNDPSKIIRVENFEDLLDKHNNKIGIKELVEIAKKLYKELEEKYGITAPVDFFVGKDKSGKDVVFSIVDKIEVKDSDKVEKSNEIIKKMEKLYVSIAKYFLDKFKEGGLYLWDICSQDQYLYGRKFGEQEAKVYLIDTDIWLSKSRTDMYLSVYWLTRHMSVLERRFNTKFNEARYYISQFINQQLPEGVNANENKNIEAIRKFLNGEKSNYNPKSAIPSFE